MRWKMFSGEVWEWMLEAVGEKPKPAPHLAIPLDDSRPMGTLKVEGGVQVQPAIIHSPATASPVAQPREVNVMSLFGNFEHTFVGWVEKEWAKFQAEAPKVEDVVDEGFKYATGVLTIVKTELPSGSKAVSVINTALRDITTASAVVFDAGAHPTVGNMISDVVTNLKSILDVSQVTNPETVGKVTKVVDTLSAVASVFLQIAPAVA